MRTSLLTFALLLLTTGASMAGVLRVGTWSSSGATPHSSLTAALAAAQAGDEVWVVSNTYQEAEFIVPAGVSVYGGFIGSETSLSERNYATNVTILDGSGAHRVATVSGLLDGFTLRNGRTGDNGGGVLVKSGGVLSHCVAFANEAGYDGGGVFAEEGATVSNTLLANNRAGNDGTALGGVAGYRAVNLTAVDNTFTDKPEIKKVLVAPASLVAGDVLNVAEPDILDIAEVDPHGSTILMKGWELDGHAISMPYTVTYADNGKQLRYWAANAVGVGVSNEVALTVTWTVASSAQLLTPKAVCEGTTLIAAGIGNPVFSPAPDGGATYTYYIDGTPISGLDHALQYSDNGKLLTCEIKNGDGSIVGATTPAVRLAVMKAPDVLLTNIGNLSIEEGQPLCLPTPVVISNGSDVTAQGWKWRIGAGAENTFNSCDKATTAMNGATLYYTAENGCSTTPTAETYTTLTVTNPVGEFLQSVSALCAGMTLNDCISFNVGGNTGDYYIGNTYIGTPGAEGNFTTSWDDIKTTALTTAHNLQVLRFSYNGGKSERRMTLTVHAVPEITTDPATPVNALCLGDAHTLTIEATGDNLSYQWERSTNSTDGSDGDWDNVPGSTTAACRLTADVSAYYRCTVTGVCIDKSAGVVGNKIISAAAQLTVNDRPVIPNVTTSIPLTLCEGETVTALLTPLKPTLGGTPATAEGWTLGGINIADDYPVVATDNGKVFGYRASNACGERTVTFSTLKLTVDSKPLVTQDPLDVTAVEDTPVRLSVSASGSNLTYQWQQKVHDDADIDASWHDIVGETNPAYSYTAANITTAVDLDGANVLTDYRCVVGTTNACVATTVASALATVTVTRSKSAVSIRRQPAAYEVCNSETAPYAPGFTVEVEGSGRFVYKWYAISDKTTPVAQTPASGNLADAVADKTNTFQPTAAGTYFCVVTSTDDHAGAQTQTIVLTVSQAPVINGITPTNATICEGGSVTLGVDAVGSALTYQWYEQTGYTQTPTTDVKKGTALTYTPVGLTSTAKFYCVVGSGSVCTQTVASTTVEVTVEQAPKITTQPVSQAVCGATGISLNVVATNTDTYQWYHNGLPVAEADGGKADVLTGVTDGGVYTCVVSKTGGLCGEATSVPALITVSAAPTVSLGLEVVGMAAVNGQVITLPAPAIETGGSVIVPEKTGWYLNTEPEATANIVFSYRVNGTATYRYKLTYKCSEAAAEQTLPSAAMPEFTVALNDDVTITSQPVSASVCKGNTVSLSVTASGIGLVYVWEYSPDGVAWGPVTSGANGPVLNAVVTSTVYYRCVVTSAGGTVATSTAAVITMTDIPAAFNLTQTGALSGCERDEVELENIPDAGYWTLGGQPIGKPDNNKYKLNAADDGKVLRYVKTNLCGERVSTNSRAVSVSREPRLTSVLATPYIIKQGAKLDLTAPTNTGTLDANYPKWTLDGKNGTTVTMGTTVPALTDDGKLLTYSVMGCHFLDETSTTLRVWSAPVVGGTSSTTNPVYGKEGSLFGLPSLPVVTPNNCTVESAGWKYDAASNKEVSAHGTTTGLADLNKTSFDTHDGKYLYYEVAYTIPGDATTYYVRKAFGWLKPWKEPTIGTTTPQTWDYVCDNKTFAQMGKTFATVNITNAYNCTFGIVTWETEDGRVVTTGSRPALTDDNKKLYCVQTWTAPDGSATGKVKAHVATMRVNNVPKLTVTEAAPQTADVIYIDQRIDTYYKQSYSDALGRCTLKRTPSDEKFKVSHNDSEIEFSAVNNCATTYVKFRINLCLRKSSYYPDGNMSFYAIYQGNQTRIFKSGYYLGREVTMAIGRDIRESFGNITYGKTMAQMLRWGPEDLRDNICYYYDYGSDKLYYMTPSSTYDVRTPKDYELISRFIEIIN